jgi:pimeloyl-ACP methyl ester carboxylesterase
MRSVAASVVVLLTVMAAPAVAQTGLVDRPVTFSVINKNDSLMRCPTDGRQYTLRGSLVAPAAAMERSPRSITLLIHGAMLPGDELWRFRPNGDRSYDFTLAMARLGHAVVTVSLVGYGDTVGPDFPQGNLVCQGGNADAISQIVEHLKRGSYTFGGASPGPAFDRVAIFGSSFGGQYVQVAAYSFDNIDALVTLGWADPILPTPVGVQFTGSTALTCFTGGEPKNDDGSGPSGYVLRPGELAVGVQWTDATPEAEDFWIRSMERDPCGNQTTIPARFVADVSGLPRIDIPTLVVDGTGDELVGWIAPHVLFSRLTGTDDKTLMLFPDAGHSFFLERRRAEWTRRISGWMKERGY